MVFGVIFSIILTGSIVWSFLTSAKTGIAPTWAIEEVDEIKEFGGVMTSSPLFIPKATRPHTNASVPLFKATQYLTLDIYK